MTNEEIRLNRYCKHCRNYDKGCDWLCRGMICQAADESGCVVIHTEHLTDEQREEIANAIADFLTEKFPDYAKRILN